MHSPNLSIFSRKGAKRAKPAKKILRATLCLRVFVVQTVSCRGAKKAKPATKRLKIKLCLFAFFAALREISSFAVRFVTKMQTSVNFHTPDVILT
ncbi:MAG: hypothetical protein BGP14_01395 [Sphingobacteriales bacterium 44-15]|nr:MAG: hypothetical protein BGP14_01395 [Sphingobacteriales bacterium 44-15]